MADVKITIVADNKASKDIDDVSRSLDGLGKEAQEAGDSGKKFGVDWEVALLGINQGLEIANKAIQATKRVFDFTREGASIQQTQKSFASLLSTIGEGPDVLNEWRNAVGGTVDDLTIMTGFQTLAAGLSDEMTQAFYENNAALLEISRAASVLNPQLGDTAYMYESITTGIKRNSPLILDNLGIVVKAGEANAIYAESLGKTVEELTAEEKQMALLNAVLQSGDQIINQLGGSVASTTQQWDEMSTSMENAENILKSISASAVQPLISDLANMFNALASISTGIESITGTNLFQWFWDLNAAINPVYAVLRNIGTVMDGLGKKSIPELISEILEANKVLSWMSGTVNNLIWGFGQMKGLIKGAFRSLFGGGGSNEAAGGIVHAASGVSASAPYWVGELGPEPFFPSQDGRIVSNSEAKAAMRGGGGKTQPITVVINTPMNFADKVWVENELAPYIRDAMARAQL